MAGYITAIRTGSGDLPVDYNSLANLPSSDTTLTKSGSFADAKAVGDKIKNVQDTIKEIQGGDTLAGITINGKNISSNPVLTATDVGAAPTKHSHDASDFSSGTLSIAQGGIGANNGSDGLKNLLASGPMVLSSGKQYGTQAQFDELKASQATVGQIFFVKVT